MNEFRLPPETQISHVHLQVANLERALGFYRDLLGFRQASQSGGTAALSATRRPPHRIYLTQRPDARPKPPRTAGLYHVAIRYPSRQALARAFQRLVEHHVPFQGFSDHLVSEALYLADPDGNGLELYADRPRDQWPHNNGQIAMGTEPLDVEDLLAEADGDKSRWNGVEPGTAVGHVHLQVTNLAQAEAFYHGLLGLDVTQRGYPGALFLSAGGYHHHLGLNVWSSARGGPVPPDAVGLLSFGLSIPKGDAKRNLRLRLGQAGVEMEELSRQGNGTGILVRDPDGNGVEIL